MAANAAALSDVRSVPASRFGTGSSGSSGGRALLVADHATGSSGERPAPPVTTGSGCRSRQPAPPATQSADCADGDDGDDMILFDDNGCGEPVTVRETSLSTQSPAPVAATLSDVRAVPASHHETGSSGGKALPVADDAIASSAALEGHRPTHAR